MFVGDAKKELVFLLCPVNHIRAMSIGDSSSMWLCVVCFLVKALSL